MLETSLGNYKGGTGEILLQIFLFYTTWRGKLANRFRNLANKWESGRCLLYTDKRFPTFKDGYPQKEFVSVHLVHKVIRQLIISDEAGETRTQKNSQLGKCCPLQCCSAAVPPSGHAVASSAVCSQSGPRLPASANPTPGYETVRTDYKTKEAEDNWPKNYSALVALFKQPEMHKLSFKAAAWRQKHAHDLVWHLPGSKSLYWPLLYSTFKDPYESRGPEFGNQRLTAGSAGQWYFCPYMHSASSWELTSLSPPRTDSWICQSVSMMLRP